MERLLADPKTLAAAARLLLDVHFTPVLAELICAAVDLDVPALDLASSGEAAQAARLRPRRRGFAEEVLRAYAYQCAMCGFDGALGRYPVGIEAAHARQRHVHPFAYRVYAPGDWRMTVRRTDVADAAESDGAGRTTAAPSRLRETLAPMPPVPSDALGLVAGTVPATPLKYSVSLAPGQYAQLDDVVVTQRGLPGRGSIQIAGVVTNVEAVHEGARFASDVFLIEQGALPAEVCEVAEVTVTRVEPEMYVPPLPGAPVTRAAGAQRDSALYFDEMGSFKVPVGFARDGQPVYVNFEFVDGTRGAHVSISGVSGIATKTSFAMFLLHSIIHCGVLKGEAHNTKALIFSVKSEDLLFLDYANSRLTPAQREQYAALGLPAEPFGNVRVFAPPRRDDPAGTPDVSARDRAVSPFYWTLAEFCEQELLPFVFADAEDERAQYTMLIGQVAARLRRDVIPAGHDGAIRIRGVNPDRDKILRSFGDLVTLLEAELGDDSTRASWVAGSAVTGSVNALLRRLHSAVRPLSVIVRGDLAYRGERSITTSRAQVTVIDLHNLPERAQRFAVGVTLRGEFARKERQGTARPLMFVMLDELNKYAPREGGSPIKQLLLDIAERGRSLGVILIGAQQTASEVERRIVANCAIRVAGRLDAAEAERPEYGYLPPAQRQRATLAKPGTMFIAQPDIPVPLAVDFPFPAWATRPSEKGEWAGHDTGPARPSDPFAAIAAVDDEPPY